MTSTVVFLGPSIPKERVPLPSPSLRSPPALEIRPPVRQGDVLRALADGAKKIGIIDGYFDQVPSVWHKEILLALEGGALVYGAASMGALRAAELHTFGMIGVGRVFELYRDGILEDDDEVALLHASPEDGYRPISEAMVNLRDLADAAVAANVLGRVEADAALAQLKALPYRERSTRRLVALAPPIADFAGQPRALLKERDARLLLERIASDTDAAPQPSERARTERTVFLERLRLEVGDARTEPRAAERPRAREALLALIAAPHAASVGASPTGAEVNGVVRELIATMGLESDEALAELLEARGVDVDRFLNRMREEATIRCLERVHREEIARWLTEMALLRSR